MEELGYGPFLDRAAPGVIARVEAGEWEWPHPWLNAFLPGSTADVVIKQVLAELSPTDPETSLMSVVFLKSPSGNGWQSDLTAGSAARAVLEGRGGQRGKS